MYYQIFQRGALDERMLDVPSDPISLGDANAAVMSLKIVMIDGEPSVTCRLQQSSDLENWSDCIGDGTLYEGNKIAFIMHESPARNLAAQYLRVTAAVQNGSAIVSVGVNLTKL